MHSNNGATSVHKKAADIFLLHFSILLYSFISIFAKLAGTTGNKYTTLVYICIEFLILFIYSLLWQVILKKMTLTFAFSNKAIGVVWTALFGVLFFNEQITLTRLSGIALVIMGVVMVAKND